MLAAVGIHFCVNRSFNEEQLHSLVQYSLPEPQTADICCSSISIRWLMVYLLSEIQ